MKQFNSISKQAVLFFVVVLVLSLVTASCSDFFTLMTVEEGVVLEDVYAFELSSEHYNYGAADKNGNLVLYNIDGDTPLSASIITQDNSTLTVAFNNDGYPSRIITDEYILLMDGWGDGTADFAVINVADESVAYYPNTPVDYTPESSTDSSARQINTRGLFGDIGKGLRNIGNALRSVATAIADFPIPNNPITTIITGTVNTLAKVADVTADGLVAVDEVPFENFFEDPIGIASEVVTIAADTVAEVATLVADTAVDLVNVFFEVDTAPPDPVTDLAVSKPEDGTIRLSWTPPASDYDHATVWYGEGTEASAATTQFTGTIDAGGATISGLTNYTDYVFVVKALDYFENESEPASISDHPFDRTPPAEVSDVVVALYDNTFRIFWSDPTDADFDSIKIYYGPGNTADDATTEYTGIIDTSYQDPDMARSTFTGLSEGQYAIVIKTVDDKAVLNGSANVSDGYLVTPWMVSTTPTLATASPGYGERQNYETLVFDNKLWMIGGSGGSAQNELQTSVYSSVNGTDWVLVTDQPEWYTQHQPLDLNQEDTTKYGRQKFASTVYDGKMWVIGGTYGDNRLFDDVWYSTDGDTWTAATHEAPWGPQAYIDALEFDGKLWLFINNDSIWSTSDGNTWTEEASSVPWLTREHEIVEFQGKLWLLGGGYDNGPSQPLYYKTNDVWVSEDAVTWTQVTTDGYFTEGSANYHYWGADIWEDRAEFAAAVAYVRIWVIAGHPASNSLKDIWSSDDGIHWVNLDASNEATWYDRDAHTAEFFDGKLFFFDGYSLNSLIANDSTPGDIWYY